MPLNNTDYNKKFMDLYDALPEVYRSNTNRSTFYNLFNRFLTKQDVRKVAGYIGEPNINAIVRRQIEEPTLHRQAYQLQPILNASIGSVPHMASWKDIEKELERLGVDIDRMDEWGSIQVFNWIPPIDIDKLINWQNYYWDGDPGEEAEYITIRNQCSVATSQVTFWENIIEEHGASHTITEVLPYLEENLFPSFNIIELNGITNRITVEGNVAAYLGENDYFYVYGTTQNNGKHRINEIEYDRYTEITTIKVIDGTLNDFAIETVGTVRARFFDKLVVAGDVTPIFIDGFTFFIKNSTNTDLNVSFWRSYTSTYDAVNDETTITLKSIITDNTADGDISLSEQLGIVTALKQCLCGQSLGWDSSQWDDNPKEPLWGGDGIGDHARWLASVSHTTAPPVGGPSGDNKQWYHTPSDILYIWEEADEYWKITSRNFSFILEQTKGVSFWDSTEGCSESVTLDSALQWIRENKWIHRLDIGDNQNVRRAQAPIIEFQWDLQLNEWSRTTYTWKHRANEVAVWEDGTEQPTLLELMPFSLWETGVSENIIILDERYGDRTDDFYPGFQFRAAETTETYTVISSHYKRDNAGKNTHFRTNIVIEEIIANTDLVPGDLSTTTESTTSLRPLNTTFGIRFQKYGDHWLFVEANNSVAAAPVQENLLIDPPITETPLYNPGWPYGYITTAYAQIVDFLVDEYSDPILFVDSSSVDSTRYLRRRALLGNNDIRVYINDIRQYGNYDELGETEDGIEYVRGIQFLDVPSARLNLNDVVRIEVGEATQEDLGLYSIPVRTHELNSDYNIYGNTNISLVSLRKTEQTKTVANQPPLFDIYRVTGEYAADANPIFGFRTSPDYPVNNHVDQRIVYDSTTKVYDFEQHLITENNGELFAYRDFSNLVNDFWYQPDLQKLFFWNGSTWTEKTLMGNFYRAGYVSPNEPGFIERQIDGFYWYDTGNNLLKVRNTQLTRWDIVDDVMVALNDHTLQTIWKEGLNKEEYVPEKVDWDKRTEAEYNEEKELYVDYSARQLMENDDSLTEGEAIIEATALWYAKESNVHSESGEWVGDWELPDPLYYNNMHENRMILNSAELRPHFNSIIANQPIVPGFTGNVGDMFHLIRANDVNYGLGGTIHEYNDGFDTFLSSAFVKNVTPISLLEFAADQYAVLLLNSIIEVYKENIIEYLTATTTASKNDIGQYVSDSAISEHCQNDYFTFVYGDTTTHDDDNNLGMCNWIATLPYIHTMRASEPLKLVDSTRGISELKHHDGHFETYEIEAAEREVVINALIRTPDDRTSSDTWGRSSSVNLPPDNMTEFASTFATSVNNREGVYWYYIPSLDVRTLYRFNVVSTSISRPVEDYDDGSLWFDTTPGAEVLRKKRTNSEGYPVWDVVEGLTQGDGRFHNGLDPNDMTTSTVNAWQEVDISELLVDTILAVENRLYENAPNPKNLKYDADETREINPVLFDSYMNDLFLDYVTDREIVDPYANVDYQADDPWTWNYRHCIPGGGMSIVQTDAADGEFYVSGDFESDFDPCFHDGVCPSQVSFYVKNSIVNDGTWRTLFSNGLTPVSEYDSGNDRTVIKVEGSVNASIYGFIYQGLLPGFYSTGAESGSFWKDYYYDLYGTPYPHLEPWLLQGYTTEPTWWAEEYANDNVLKWETRRWRYKHGFDIITAGHRTADTYLTFYGNFMTDFPVGDNISIDRSESGLNGAYQVKDTDPITQVDIPTQVIEVDGDHDLIYTDDCLITIYDSSNELIGTYTVDNSHYLGPPTYRTRIHIVEEITSEIDLTAKIGSIYYPATNTNVIIVNGLATIPVGSPPEYGRITKALGMWEKIRTGSIPAGRDYPNGVRSITGDSSADNALGVEIFPLERWHYFSINIDNHAHSSDGGNVTYQPDDLLPPFWDHDAAYDNEDIPEFDAPIRSVLSNYATEVVSPGSNYTFGDGGPIEWDWKSSARYNYDKLMASYRLDPIKYVANTFGVDFLLTGGLQIDSNTNNTFCHCRTNFHGDIIDTQPLYFSGTNQWYVNFNRYLSYDSNFSDFANLWKGWTAPMTYQFATFVDSKSFQIGHRSIDLTDDDYRIDTKRSQGVDDFWLDAFQASVIDIPPDIMRYDNSHEWKIEINSHLNISRRVTHYDVQNYKYYSDIATDTCVLYMWEIKAVDVYNDFFEIEGDQSDIIESGETITVSRSTGNDGTFTVQSAVFDETANRTIVEIEESIYDINADGVLKLNDYKTIPWETGERVYASSAETLPSPLVGQTINGLTELYIIKLSDTEFQVARTRGEAVNGTNIELTTTGKGDQYIGKIRSTFKALNGQRTNTIWIHYEPDLTREIVTALPTTITGMQSLVDFMDGYDMYSRNQGWAVNEESTLKDEYTGRPCGWQVEIEKFINYAYGLRSQRYTVKDSYPIQIDTTTDILTFDASNPNFKTGDKIIFKSSNGIYHNPIFKYLPYYYIYIDGTTFRIAATKRDAERGVFVDILPTNGVGDISIAKPSDRTEVFPKSGINPFRAGVWFKQPKGVISNILTGPTEDIRTVQTIVDQYGRRFNGSDLRVFREDKRSQISIKAEIPNNVDPPVYYFYPSDNDYIHIGGIHLFLDTYEHVLIFNNYTSQEDLLYDPFIGLNLTKFEMLFNRQPEFTQRPNVGGYFYSNTHNLEPTLIPNMEYQVESLRYAFDTFDILESNILAKEVRKSLGYEGIQDFLSMININEKSQFVFWRGFIHQKGTVNSVTAYLQSRRFINAKVDEFWAYKIAEFGSDSEKDYHEMYVQTDDVTSNDTGFEFIEET